MENTREIVCLDNKYCLIKINEDIPCLSIKWKGQVETMYYREAMNMAINLMHKNKIAYVLNDDREIIKISSEDQRWAVEDWLPRAFAVGYKALAVIQTKEFFKNVDAGSLAASAQFFYQGKLNINYFKTVKEAEDWFKTLTR